MSFWSKVREGYSNIDKLVGGYLPGGVKPGATKTTPTPTPTPTQQKGAFNFGRWFFFFGRWFFFNCKRIKKRWR